VFTEEIAMERANTIVIAISLFGAVGCATEVNPAAPSDAAPPAVITATVARAATHAEVANGSLRTLHALVQSGNPKLRGFQSADEVSTATLAVPLRMVMIGLNSVRAYRSGDDPRALLIDEESVMYPVVVAGEVRSSIVVRRRAGAWEAAAFGNASLAQASVTGRQQIEANREVSGLDTFLVEIPALSVRMLGHDEGGTSMLTPLDDVKGSDLRAGQTLPAAEVLAKLVPLAQQSAE
jgi:hypothetical protein